MFAIRWLKRAFSPSHPARAPVFSEGRRQLLGRFGVESSHLDRVSSRGKIIFHLHPRALACSSGPNRRLAGLPCHSWLPREHLARGLGCTSDLLVSTSISLGPFFLLRLHRICVCHSLSVSWHLCPLGRSNASGRSGLSECIGSVGLPGILNDHCTPSSWPSHQRSPVPRESESRGQQARALWEWQFILHPVVELLGFTCKRRYCRQTCVYRQPAALRGRTSLVLFQRGLESGDSC